MFKRCLHLLLPLILVIFSCNTEDNKETISICNKNDVQASSLISVTDAATLIANSKKVIIVEISKPDEYYSGHIPNAINVWRPDFRTKKITTFKGMICDVSELETFLQNIGATDDSQLLLYDNKGGCDAMRLSWVLDCYYVPNYQVINGGKAAWKHAGHSIDTIETIPIPNSEYKLEASLDSSLYAFREDVISAFGDDKTIIVDTREPYEYEAKPFIANGEVRSHKKGAFTRGSIPGAIHLNWSDLSDLANDHRIKCTKDLLYDLKAKNITKDKDIIVYCQSGSRSSHTAFILREILGYPNVKNYDGSWIEWSYYHVNGNQVPIERITSDSVYERIFTELTNEIINKNG